jgi:hypothetical protein
MRAIVAVVGSLLIVTIRCAIADDISLLEKYLPKNTNLKIVQSCQYQYLDQCNQRYTECRSKTVVIHLVIIIVV